MEQKKTLWIVLAAGIFLLVVIGAATILYAHDAKKNTQISALKDSGELWIKPSDNRNSGLEFNIGEPDSTIPDEMISENMLPANVFTPAQENSEAQESNSATTENLTVIANGETTIFDMTGSSITAQNRMAAEAIRENEILQREKPAYGKEITLVPSYTEPVVIPEPKVEPKKTTSAVKSQSQAKTAAVSAETQKKTPSKATIPAKQTVAPKSVTAKTTAGTSKATEPSSAEPDRFWVQVASYTTKKAADQARIVLDENKIQCEVFTYTDAKGKLYYRVRVGPYTTKSEGEYWKKRIESIDMFKNAGSYVVNSTTK